VKQGDQHRLAVES